MKLRCCDRSHVLTSTCESSCQWSECLHHWSPFLEHRSVEILFLQTYSWSSWHQQLYMDSFNPLTNIVDCNQDVLTVLWLWKWTHVFNTLDIKEFDLEVVCECHGISWIDVPMPLTWTTPLNEVLHVFIHGWPEKSTLPDLCMSAECTIMPPIWWWVASFYDLDAFFCRCTPPE